MGYIKDYDGGTLMECIISDRLPYTDLPGMLRAQRAALDRHIRTLSKSHVVHPGLTSFRDGQRRVDIASIPGAALLSLLLHTYPSQIRRRCVSAAFL